MVGVNIQWGSRKSEIRTKTLGRLCFAVKIENCNSGVKKEAVNAVIVVSTTISSCCCCYSLLGVVGSDPYDKTSYL